MGDELQTAKETLGNDEVRAKSTHNWSTFIKDLDAELKDPKLQAKQAELKQEAQRLLKDAGFGDLQIDGVQDGKILEHTAAGKAQFIDKDGKVTDQQPGTNPPTDGSNARDDQKRVTTNDSQNHYTYDDKGALNAVTWTGQDKQTYGFKKNPPDATHPNGQWVDEAGKPFKDGGDPTIDQKTGDLSYQKADGPAKVEKADGGVIEKNDKGAPATVTDKAGNQRAYTYNDDGTLKSVDYTANGQTDKDPKQSWTKQDDGTWANGDTPPQTRKDITVDPTTGDYKEVSADGTKKHVEHTDGTATDGDNKADPPPAPEHPAKKSLHDQWVEARKQSRIDSEKDVNDGDKHTIKFGDTMWDVAKASAKKNSTDHHPPTNTEVSNEVDRLVAKYNKAHADKPITNKNNVPIGTEIDTSPEKAENPTPSDKPNDVKGDKGQIVHYAPDDKEHKTPTGVDYPNGMKSKIAANGDVSVTGDPANGGKTYTLAKQPDNTYKRQDETGKDVDPPQIYSGVDVSATDGSMTLTAKDGSHIATVHPDGKTTDVKYDGKGTEAANVTGVDYPNGMKTTVATNGDIEVNGDPANSGKKYTLVKQTDNTYKRQDETGKDVDPAQIYRGAAIDPAEGTLTLTAKDGSHIATTHPDGTTTDVKYDGKGTAAENVTEVDYPNGMKATLGSGGEVDVTGDPASPGKDYKLVKQSDGSYAKQNTDGTAFDPPQTYSNVEVDPDDGSLTLTGKKDGHDHTTTLNSDGSTTEADVAPPAPTAPTADKAVVKYDAGSTDPNKINEIDYASGVKATITRDTDGSIKEMDFTSDKGVSKIVKNGDHYDITPPPKAGDTINADGVSIDPDTGKVVLKGKHADGTKFYITVTAGGAPAQVTEGDPPNP
jgi:YD repeat-containing protein